MLNYTNIFVDGFGSHPRLAKIQEQIPYIFVCSSKTVFKNYFLKHKPKPKQKR